jgi:hypothetical protein
MAEPSTLLHGYHVPILRGVWERIIVFGAPRFYARAWACFWLFVGLILLTYWGFRWLPLPFLGWLPAMGSWCCSRNGIPDGMIWQWPK